MDDKLRLSTLTLIAFNINWAIEEGHGSQVSFDEIYSWLKEGKILERLNNKISDVFDFSQYPTGSDQAIAFNSVIHNVAGGLEGRERRKIGIKRNGLSLLLAFIIEAIQQKQWVMSER